MAGSLLFPTILVFIILQSLGVTALQWPAPSCNRLVDRFEKEHGKHVTPKNITDAFIFFLHVPRTAGKTYASCFLRASLPPTQRCAPSYDMLRLNISQEGCRYVVSHDDYSLTSQLPDNTVIVSQLRDPVTRLLSSYEFAIEVAARKIKQSDETFWSTARNFSFVNTLNVFPWSYLVPWFRIDMRAKMKALGEQADEKNSTRPRFWTEHFDKGSNRTFFWSKDLNQSVWRLPAANTTLNSYDNVLVTPLKDWIETDIAREFVHDGHTLQVLGLTNYSHWDDAKALRSCFFEDPKARSRLLNIAKDRIRSMLHVGLTEELDLSVASLAAGLERKLSSPSYKSVPKNMFSYDGPEFDPEQTITYNATRNNPSGKITSMTVREARLLLVHLQKRVTVLNNKLKGPEAELQELVDKEDAWLEEQAEKKEKEKQEEEKKAETAAAKKKVSGGSSSSEVSQATGLLKKLEGWVQSLFNWPPTAAAAASGSSTTDGSTDADSISSEYDDTESDNNNDDSSNDSSSKEEESETSVSEAGNKSDDGPHIPEPEYVFGSQNDPQEEEEEEEEEEAPQEGEEKIESPWSERIEKLDAQVYAMQQERDAVQRDIDALFAIPEVKGPELPEGRAKLLAPESDFRESATLGETYRKCAHDSTKRAASKRRNAFKDLVTPWHESFGFSSAARKALDPDLIARIRELNSADIELYELGKQLLHEAIEEQRAAGTLDELPPAVSKKEEMEQKADSDENKDTGDRPAAALKEGGVGASEGDHDEL